MTLSTAVSDAQVIALRNLVKIKRVPDLLVFTTLSPIMFVLLFAYVFGGAIGAQAGGAAYREFLIAGIFAQTVVFGATITGAALATEAAVDKAAVNGTGLNGAGLNGTGDGTERT